MMSYGERMKRLHVNSRSSGHRSITLALCAALVCAAACRDLPPTSGTPLQSGESLETGVRREQHVYGVRRGELLASTEKMATDVSELLGAGERERIPRIRIEAPENSSGMPAASFGHLRHELVLALVEAGPAHGLEFVRAGAEGDPVAVDYVLFSRVLGSGAGDRLFLFDYELVEENGERTAALWSARYPVAAEP